MAGDAQRCALWAGDASFRIVRTQQIALLKAHTEPLEAFDDHQHLRYHHTIYRSINHVFTRRPDHDGRCQWHTTIFTRTRG